ncbi:hypothetical protein BDV39DRAFT_199394 [Aspergillus sergii]|uniref:Uncharacterized protein n=1 Tax=Aspergillus sergii TaxID=1034303 RepID=A0A5N6XJV4_9EURO|nr:hypothetical protein BDV39DRAFT_199394 [Aspergillus sergii]
MVEAGNPSTDAIQLLVFTITSAGANTPGMIFGNSSTSGTIDFFVCKLWAQISAMLDVNATASTGPNGSVLPSPRSSPTCAGPFEDGAVYASVGGSIVVSALRIVGTLLV